MEEDPTGSYFAFEAGAKKTGGGQGFADVWYRGRFAIEYKGPDGNLEKAYTQLLQYREALENPPLLIVSDFQTIIIHTNFTNSVKATTTLTLDDLLTPQGLQALRNVFFNPAAFRPERTAEQVTEEAATRFAHLAEHLRKWGYAPLPIAHYLIRLLFCLFAEDIDLLPARTVHPPGGPGPPRPAAVQPPNQAALSRHERGRRLWRAFQSATSTAGCSTMTPCLTWTATG